MCSSRLIQRNNHSLMKSLQSWDFCSKVFLKILKYIWTNDVYFIDCPFWNREVLVPKAIHKWWFLISPSFIARCRISQKNAFPSALWRTFFFEVSYDKTLTEKMLLDLWFNLCAKKRELLAKFKFCFQIKRKLKFWTENWLSEDTDLVSNFSFDLILKKTECEHRQQFPFFWTKIEPNTKEHLLRSSQYINFLTFPVCF